MITEQLGNGITRTTNEHPSGKSWEQIKEEANAALRLPYACDLSLYSFGEAKDLLIEYFGGCEDLHYLLRVNVQAKSRIETEITHFYPQILVDTTDQDDVDNWEVVGFRFNAGKFWHKTVFVEGA